MNLQHQQSHVPKFGNWDSDNIPYTAYFENARKEKAACMRMNPNDPEENPDLYLLPKRRSFESNSKTHQNRTYASFVSNKSVSNMVDQSKNGSHKTVISESRSGKSNSDTSLLQPKYGRARSDKIKFSIEGSNSFKPMSIAGLRSRNHSIDDSGYKMPSIPKFGAWDETDPKSGEGYTIIFDEVKKEKHIASTTFPSVAAQSIIYSNGQKRHGSPPPGSKVSVPKLLCRLKIRSPTT
ncbi:RIN4, pathogenic type III effector avirulence factor Avr cleavage site [Dillenia turbinata]|uniref:RIN4, pathogenic type III effector avirulence factor Avr cleavage site n=1 Tax=Dillenia turbinata TaxID=194707 RepID=A0AAN8Z214_9MAGN